MEEGLTQGYSQMSERRGITWGGKSQDSSSLVDGVSQNNCTQENGTSQFLTQFFPTPNEVDEGLGGKGKHFLRGMGAEFFSPVPPP